MKKQLFIYAFLVCAFPALSQDTLITVKNDTLIGRITDQKQRTVKYTLADDTRGTVHSISKIKLKRLKYNREGQQVNIRPFQPDGTFRSRRRKNLNRAPFAPGNNLLGAGIKRFGINDGINAAYILYEHRFLRNRMSAAISPHFGLSEESLGAAIGLRYMPHPYKRVNFMVGSYLQIWKINRLFRFYSTGQEPSLINKTLTVGSILLNTGAKINLTKNWVIIPEVGWGVPKWGYENDIVVNGKEYTRSYTMLETSWLMQISLGYRF